MCDNIATRRVLETYNTRIFDTLGLIAKEESVGFPSSASGAADLETLVMPHLEALADFRGAVRGMARQVGLTVT